MIALVLDVDGAATVELPDWFEAINTDYRYQLTCIGGFAPVYVAREIELNTFELAGGDPFMKVSWCVTAARNDAHMRAHPFGAERDKSPAERGYYLDPEALGATRDRGLNAARQRWSTQIQDRADVAAVRERIEQEMEARRSVVGDLERNR